MQDVAKLGRKYEVREVAAGFARNFLIPSGKAVVPDAFSPDRLKALQDKHLNAVAKRAEELSGAIAALTDKKIVLTGKANDEGHLFAGIGKETIAEGIKSQLGITLDSSEVHLGHSLKAVGTHEVEVGEGNKIQVIIETEA